VASWPPSWPLPELASSTTSPDHAERPGVATPTSSPPSFATLLGHAGRGTVPLPEPRGG
jgi:hypothetical protein